MDVSEEILKQNDDAGVIESINQLELEETTPAKLGNFVLNTKKNNTNVFRRLLNRTSDVLLLPLSFVSGLVLKRMRTNSFTNYPLNRKLLLKLGVFPIIDHYYEPLFNPKYIRESLSKDRFLPSIDLNIEEQLEILKKFSYKDELLQIPIEKSNKLEYYFNNTTFLSGDGEYLYNIIRHFKPNKIVEIGSGLSTLMASRAIQMNQQENPDDESIIICIEPFEHPWLEKLNVKVLRRLVEDIDLSFFESLDKNDILFIDSSHIIKPQGDVLFLFLKVLPILKPGVIIHVHDIFTPKDYLEDWVINKNRFWNEQYLLEAFLSYNDKFRIIGALNYLRHYHYRDFSEKCPVLKMQVDSGKSCEPGSIWLRKT